MPDLPPPARLTVRVCLGFGVGSLGLAVLLNTVTTLFPALMTTVLGMSAALAGVMLMFSKIYDGVADVIVGLVSDRTRSRIGRRRPYLLIGALLSGISFLLIFMPPRLSPSAMTLYMGFALIVYSSGYALFAVPYLAMAGEMTDGYHERTRLISYRTFFVAAGQTMAAAGTAGLIVWAGGGARGYAVMGLVAGTIVLLSMSLSFIGTATARVVHATTRQALNMDSLRSLLGNRPFMLLMAIKLSQFIAIATISTTKVLFGLNVLGLGYWRLATLALVQNLVLASSLVLWLPLSRRIGKTRCYALATALLAMVYISWFFTRAGVSDAELWVRGALNGVAAAGTTLMGTSMLPDVMEYDRQRTGQRREGIFSSVYTIIEKAGFAIGAGLTGVLVTTFGYIPTLGGNLVQQPGTAIKALYAGSSYIPAAFALLSLLLLYWYRLDEATLRAGAATRAVQ
jgi:GPH family glycoside/pentoside/hexuronide:cation symporter